MSSLPHSPYVLVDPNVDVMTCFLATAKRAGLAFAADAAGFGTASAEAHGVVVVVCHARLGRLLCRGLVVLMCKKSV